VLYILHGPDDFSRSEALAVIKREIEDPTLLAANITLLDSQKLTPENLRNVCETMPFLSGKRLIIIEGLLGRFESRNKTSRPPKANSKANKKDDYKTWAGCFSQTPESTVVVLVDEKVNPGNPLFKELSGGATVKSFPLLSRARLRPWIEKRVGEAGGRISPPAAELLIKNVGSNLWVMHQEIMKLTLLAAGRAIEPEDVRDLVGCVQQDSVFAMVDAILELRAAVAEGVLQQLLERGAAPAYLMAMLTRQIRIVARIKGLQHQRKSAAEIQKRLGLASDFVFRKALEQAGRFSLARIKEVYLRLLETDLAIKTGKYKGELALGILIADLCQAAPSG
jgi:DNA polymerase-3 subunit delta